MGLPYLAHPTLADTLEELVVGEFLARPHDGNDVTPTVRSQQPKGRSNTTDRILMMLGQIEK